MTVYFTNPWVLLLMITLIPLVVLTARSLIGISGFRKCVIMIFRSLLFLLLVCALAGLKLAHKSDELAVFFLLDVSKSIPRHKIQEAIDWINEVSKTMKQNDSAGLVVFGSEPSIEKNPVKKFSIKQIQSQVDDNRTDIASALRLCLAAFPEHTQKKIVLITDGNENVGNALDSAYMAKSNKTPILVKLISITAKQDVRIEKMVAPQSSVKDAPFDLKVFLSTQYDTRAKLRIFKDDELILDKTVPVADGKKNLYTVRVTLPDAGFHRFKALIEAPNDTIADNNIAYSFTYVKDIPNVLFVEGNPIDQTLLPPLLSQEKIHIDLIEPSNFPESLNALISYDCIVLSNVAMDKLTFRQMEIIEKAVHNLGIGLVVIGGDQAYGPGGYQDTPLESALPVSMEVTQRKVLPNGALVIILHTCEIPQGNSWAREITLAALRVLSRKDYFGVLYYGAMGGEQWLFKPTLCTNKAKLISLIKNVVPQDMPTFDTTLRMAYNELMKLNTYVKHIVIISDGDPATPNSELIKKISKAKITISTVVINPHSQRDANVMGAIAKLGKGNFYYPKDYNKLPRIFTKEAMVIRKSAIFEKPFLPQYVSYSDILAGFSSGEFPQLLGYVSTTPKDTAVVPLIALNEDPLLAMWRYGLGKAIAFTSDATSRWAQHWIQWDKFDKFWAQVIRWAIRETAGGNYMVSTSTEGETTRIVLDALDNNGYFINYLQPHATIVDPEFQTYELELTQISPGKYATEFKTTTPGNYMMSINVGEKDKPRIIIGGISVSYSPEFNDSHSNERLLQEIARSSGGAMITPETNIFLHNPPTVWQPQDIWQYLVAFAVILLLFDIFVRRVVFGWAEVKEAYMAVAAQFAKIKLLIQTRRRVPATVQTTSTLLKRRKELWEKRQLKEQTTSELLKKLKGIEPEPDEDIVAQPSEPAVKKKEKLPVSPEVASSAPETQDETHIQKLLDAKKRRKKR
ncbi:VWA domain-containing protein [Candidatus Sumerlaeota bacterium]|nr:VWA domain-containing protein [Candidatus Sumerlaeota bacterium]